MARRARKFKKTGLCWLGAEINERNWGSPLASNETKRGNKIIK